MKQSASTPFCTVSLPTHSPAIISDALAYLQISAGKGEFPGAQYTAGSSEDLLN